MDAETEAEKERIRLWSEKFNIDDLEHKVTIGAGSFGQVILVKHRQTGKVYALKVLPIAHVIRLKQVDHVKQEKEVLQQLDHPFIVNLVWSHHDLRLLYMMFEYVCGGELYAYLHRHKQFSDDVCRFYTSEIALAFEYMHKKRIAYRDLKPENLLLDRRGHIKIADFGFAKTVEDRTYTFCGTPEYVAPEIVQNSGHGTAVDWWALGILVYEMLTGDAPFVGETNEKTWEKILKGSISWPPQIKTDAKDIIKRFLTKDPTSRLASGTGCEGTSVVSRHRLDRSLRQKVKAAVRSSGGHGRRHEELLFLRRNKLARESEESRQRHAALLQLLGISSPPHSQ